MGRMANLRAYDEILTNVVRGYSNAAYIGNLIAPTVTVRKEAGKYPIFGKESFRVWNDLRAIKADTKQLEVEWFTTGTYATEEHALSAPIDYREAIEGKEFIDLEVHAAKTAFDGIQLNKEKAIADAVFAAASYDTNNKVTLTDDFLNEAEVDPISYLESKNAVLRKTIGRRANTIIIGGEVWRYLCYHPKVVAYLANSERALVTPQIFGQILGIDNVLIGEARYTVSNSNVAAPVYADIWGNGILLAYKSKPNAITANMYEPNVAFVFQKQGNPFAGKYTSLNGKVSYAEATDNYDVVVAGSDAGFMITNPIDTAIYSGA